MESIQFTGRNWDEVKEFHPNIERFTNNVEHPYTVGWKENGIIHPDRGTEELTFEALPGYFIVKRPTGYKIYDPETFADKFGE